MDDVSTTRNLGNQSDVRRRDEAFPRMSGATAAHDAAHPRGGRSDADRVCGEAFFRPGEDDLRWSSGKRSSGKVNMALIQARMGSSRFPGKVLEDLAGHPMIWHVVNRTRRAKNIDKVVVASTD